MVNKDLKVINRDLKDLNKSYKKDHKVLKKIQKKFKIENIEDVSIKGLVIPRYIRIKKTKKNSKNFKDWIFSNNIN